MKNFNEFINESKYTPGQFLHMVDGEIWQVIKSRLQKPTEGKITIRPYMAQTSNDPLEVTIEYLDQNVKKIEEPKNVT